MKIVIHRDLLKYAFDSMCKHEGDDCTREGINRVWCLRCHSWVYESDFKMIKRIERALALADKD